jgi:hypothetical protein
MVEMRGVLLVTGFHRSGTSLVTNLLQQAGLFIGERLLEPAPSNPYGHFEDTEVVDIHERILRDNGTSWQRAEPLIPVVNPVRWRAMEDLVMRRRREQRLWGFKDPRLCLFLPVWKHIIPEARVVVVFRGPAECAGSLEHRHGQHIADDVGRQEVHRRFFDEPDLALRMWLTYNLAVLRFASRYPGDVHAVSFESIRRGYPLTSVLRRCWGLALSEVPTHTVFDPAVTEDRGKPLDMFDPGLLARLQSVVFRLHRLEQIGLERV